jgi:hypothetical protein
MVIMNKKWNLDGESVNVSHTLDLHGWSVKYESIQDYSMNNILETNQKSSDIKKLCIRRIIEYSIKMYQLMGQFWQCTKKHKDIKDFFRE